MPRAKQDRATALLIAGATLLAIGWTNGAAAQQFIGLDPFMRPVYGRSALVEEPSPTYGPVYRSRPGRIGGPKLAGPLYYADPVPAVGRRYNVYSASRAGAVLGFDQDEALAQARGAELARRR